MREGQHRPREAAGRLAELVDQRGVRLPARRRLDFVRAARVAVVPEARLEVLALLGPSTKNCTGLAHIARLDPNTLTQNPY